MIDTEGRHTGELGYAFVVDALQLRDRDGYVAHRKVVADRELGYAVMQMTGDGRTYLVKAGEWEECQEPEWFAGIAQRYPATEFRRRLRVVLARRTDAEVGEAIAGIEPLFNDAYLRDHSRVQTEDGREYAWSGRCWERTR